MKKLTIILAVLLTACAPQSKVFPWQRPGNMGQCVDVRIELSVNAEASCPRYDHFEPQEAGLSSDGTKAYYDCYCDVTARRR